jgi:hypothetical protein
MADIFEEVCDQMARDARRYGTFHSDHEAYAVALEELDEVWEQVKRREADRDRGFLRHELIQVAAVCLRWATQLES